MGFSLRSFTIFVQFLGIVIAAVHREFRDTSNQGNEAECTTPACSEIGTRIILDMDITVNPCDDFYQYTCGSFLKRDLPSDVGYVGNPYMARSVYKSQFKSLFEADYDENDTRPVRLVKMFYRACTNERSIEKKGVLPLKTLIQMLGGWPVVRGNSWDESSFDWLATTAGWTRAGLPGGIFLAFNIEDDRTNLSRRVLSIRPPSWIIDSRNLKSGFNGNAAIRAYYQLMIDIAVSLGAGIEKAKAELKEALEFQIKLNNVINAAKNEMLQLTLQTLTQGNPGVNWTDIYARLYSPIQTIRDDDNIVVYRPTCIKDMIALVSNTSKRVLANFAMFQIIASTLSTMNKEIVEKLRVFDLTQYVYPQISERWMFCVDIVKKGLPVIVNAMYVKNFLKPEIKADFEDMVAKIRQEFRANIDKVPFLDDATKASAKRREAKIKVAIGQPNEPLDNVAAEKYYEDLDLFDDYFFDTLRVIKFHYDKKVRTLRKPINDLNSTEIFHMYLTGTPFAEPSLNSLSFPAGRLQRSYFNPKLPRYVDFATVGATIGHEITHLFGTEGKFYDENNDRKDWFTPVSEQGFEEQASCFINQYGNYIEPDVNVAVDGHLTLEENIADNAGVKRAYHAWVNTMSGQETEKRLSGLNFTPRQMFWIVYGNVRCDKYRPEILKYSMETSAHVPNRCRITETLSNSEEFAKDFNCRLGSKMNPVKKCSIW